MKKSNKGFTLIELMIVIAIIAILVSYAFPAYRDYVVRTKLTEGLAMASSYKTAINEAYVMTGTLSGLNNDAYGIPSLAATGSCVDEIEVVDGQLTVTYDCSTGSDGQGHPIVDISEVQIFSVVTADGTLTWTCDAVVPQPSQNPCK